MRTRFSSCAAALVVFSDHQQPRPCCNSRNEAVFLAAFAGPFGRRDDVWVHRPVERLLGALQCVEQRGVVQRVRHHHQVDVPIRPLLTSGNAAEHEGELDVVRQGHERFPERFPQADGFANEGHQFVVDRRGRVRLVELLPSYGVHPHQPAERQALQEAMRSPGAGVRQADQLRALKAAVRLAEQEAQHPLLHGREERVRQAGAAALKCVIGSH